tara:strand:+ start:1638 stop:1850 length:213 start_codon:yes stop_codon:yes gene_type:complete
MKIILDARKVAHETYEIILPDGCLTGTWVIEDSNLKIYEQDSGSSKFVNDLIKLKNNGFSIVEKKNDRES